MASKRLRYLVSYDIANAKRLRRVAKTLESYGTRLQYSVFECPLDDLRLAQARSALAESSMPTTTKCCLCRWGLKRPTRRSSSKQWDCPTRCARE